MCEFGDLYLKSEIEDTYLGMVIYFRGHVEMMKFICIRIHQQWTIPVDNFFSFLFNISINMMIFP